MKSYRHIYEDHHGPIPVDEKGRTYEIHHKDGNRKNNDPSNLVALSIEEHYKVHYSQGDYAACIRIMSRMKMTPEEISESASEINRKRASEGKHPLQKDINKKKLSERVRKELKLGIHPFQDRKAQSERAKKESRKRVNEGTHHFCNSEFHRKHAKERVRNGTHNFQTMPKIECPHCGKVGRFGPMKQHHFDNCKYRIIEKIEWLN